MVANRKIARPEAVKSQLMQVGARLIPGFGTRSQRLISAAFDQGIFWRFDVVGRDMEDEPMVVLQLEFVESRHQQQLVLQPYVRIGTNWIGGLEPELGALVGCFEDVVRKCRLRVMGLMRLKKNAPKLELDGEPVSPQRLSEFASRWIVGASGPLSQLDELSVLYLVASDLSYPTQSPNTKSRTCALAGTGARRS